MTDRLYEVLFFLSRYPRSLVMLAVGVGIASSLAWFGHQAVEGFALSGSGSSLGEVIKQEVAETYLTGVITILVATVAAVRIQFRRDKKRFDSLY
jgi:hypothetical protein